MYILANIVDCKLNVRPRQSWILKLPCQASEISRMREQFRFVFNYVQLLRKRSMHWFAIFMPATASKSSAYFCWHKNRPLSCD